MKSVLALLTSFALCLATANLTAAESLLFIGNSFTYGFGSSANFYRANTVTDLNNQGIGGVPALFKSFTDQAGLQYDVYLETQPGAGLDFHLENKLGIIGRRPWDNVVMHGFSTLDSDNPGNPDVLVATSAQMSEFLQRQNPEVSIYLTSTWSRADLIYPQDRPWTGTAIGQMAEDVRAGYDKAATRTDAIISVNPAGEAWTRAMDIGIADSNPYDGIDPGKINLWTYDHYHASTYGYYLEALVVFGNVTGRDPRSLGDNECSAYELGMSQREAGLLQQAAFEQLFKENKVSAAPLILTEPIRSQRCN